MAVGAALKRKKARGRRLSSGVSETGQCRLGGTGVPVEVVVEVGGGGWWSCVRRRCTRGWMRKLLLAMMVVVVVGW